VVLRVVIEGSVQVVQIQLYKLQEQLDNYIRHFMSTPSKYR